MSTGMVHEMAREQLEAFVLDALSASERAEVLAHVARCVACQMEVAALQAAAAQLAYAVKPVPMPDSQRDLVRARLIARARAAGASAEAEPAPPPPPVVLIPTSKAPPTAEGADAFHPSPRFHIMVPHSSAAEAALHPHRLRWMNSNAGWVAAAATFVAIVSSGMLYSVMRERDGLANALQVASTQWGGNVRAVDSLRLAVADRDRLIANLTGPRVAVMTLAANSAKSPSARMFWDQSVNAWTFVAHNLPRPKAGRVYQLWLVTANQKISAGVFVPQANGDAVVRATYALSPTALAAVAVTDEPDTGSAQPTTVPIIVGSGR